MLPSDDFTKETTRYTSNHTHLIRYSGKVIEYYYSRTPQHLITTQKQTSTLFSPPQFTTFSITTNGRHLIRMYDNDLRTDSEVFLATSQASRLFASLVGILLFPSHFETPYTIILQVIFLINYFSYILLHFEMLLFPLVSHRVETVANFL